MRKEIILAVIFIVLFVGQAFGPAIAEEFKVKSTLDDQQDIFITIYNSNLGLVREIRKIKLAKDNNEVEFSDVASQIDPTSVSFKSFSNPNAVSIMEQNYEYDLLNPNKLMEKYLNKEVELYEIQMVKDVPEEKVTKATLISLNGGAIYKIGDKISIGYPGRVVLPKIPENLIAKPTLRWLVKSDVETEQKIEVSYLTNGINWKCDYVTVIDENDKNVDLTGWVTLDNKSGATYKNAKLKLIAGDVHRVEPPTPKNIGYRLYAAEGKIGREPQFEEKSFFEYHMYTLGRRTTIKDNETKQMTLLESVGVSVVKRFIYENEPLYYWFNSQDKQSKKIKVMLEVKNSKENHLGLPLPKGKIRVYKSDDDKSLQFIGEDEIDHTPKDEKFRINIGNAFDIVGERRQTNYKVVVPSHTYEMSFEVKLRNHKKEDVIVTVIEHIYGDWKVIDKTHDFEKKDVNTVEFNVPVPKDQEVVVKYTVRIKV
ncbi:MAG: DUF4139 domain-containing protein [Candidatus Hydrogenedentota bacterium]